MADTIAVLPVVAISTGQVAFLLAYIVFIGLWAYAELIAYTRRSRYAPVANEGDEESLAAAHRDAPQVSSTKSGSAVPASPRLPATSPRTPPAVADTSVGTSGFAKCLQLDQQALYDCRLALRSAVEFGTIMMWYYLADRTTVFPQMAKSYSRDVLGFIFLVLTLVACATSLKKGRGVQLLNRSQTEEWKGWMQVLFLLYHYYEAKEIYNAIRVFIAGYVWMTGFGNFTYYYKTNDFCFARFCAMMWRLNFLVIFTCIVLQNSYMLYYICPMHTAFTICVYAALGIANRYNKSNTVIMLKILCCFVFIYVFWDIKPVFYAIWGPFKWFMGYSDPRKPTDDVLYEWHFRSSLDRYVWIHGMLCAFFHPQFEALLQRIDNMAQRTKWLVRAAIIGATMVVITLWYHHVYVLPKREYNALHPYTSWIPISCWIVLRNMTPDMRSYSLALYGWLGCITLETYISQFHSWLSTGIPDGQPKTLLQFLPPEYRLLNFALVTAVLGMIIVAVCEHMSVWRAVYVFISHRLFVLTNSLKGVAIPGKVGPLMWRNFAIITLAAGAFYFAGALVLRSGAVNALLVEPSFVPVLSAGVTHV